MFTCMCLEYILSLKTKNASPNDSQSVDKMGQIWLDEHLKKGMKQMRRWITGSKQMVSVRHAVNIQRRSTSLHSLHDKRGFLHLNWRLIRFFACHRVSQWKMTVSLSVCLPVSYFRDAFSDAFPVPLSCRLRESLLVQSYP